MDHHLFPDGPCLINPKDVMWPCKAEKKQKSPDC